MHLLQDLQWKNTVTLIGDISVEYYDEADIIDRSRLVLEVDGALLDFKFEDEGRLPAFAFRIIFTIVR